MNSPRIAEIDAIRGLALGGMLLVNLGVMTGAPFPLATQSGLDRVGAVLTLLLAEGKFYPLFALLFGWGIARRQLKASEEGKPFLSQNVQRMAVLGLFGLLHAALLWQGDILFAYAVVGMLLPLARRAPPWIIFPAAAFALLLTSLLALPVIGAALNNAYAGWTAPLAVPLHSWLNAAEGSSTILQRLAQYALKLLFSPGWLGNFAALILLGYLAGLGKLPFTTGLRQGIFAWKLCIAAALLNLIFVIGSTNPTLFHPEWAGVIRSAALSLGGPALGLVYAQGITRGWSSARWKPALANIAMLGRMPLTTYLAQSLIGSVLVAWLAPARLSAALLWPLSALIFTAQVVFARLWLSHFQRGPLEAAWRRISGAY